MNVDKFEIEGDVFFILFDIILVVVGILSNQILTYIGTFLLGGSTVKFVNDYRRYKDKEEIEK